MLNEKENHMLDDKKENEQENVSYTTAGFIVHDIFKMMQNLPERYSCETTEGLSQLETLAKGLAIKNVRSYRGTFHQAKLAGLCIASGWFYTHQHLTNEQQTEALVAIESDLRIPEYNKLQNEEVTAEKAIERSLVFGFRCGVRLGAVIKQELQEKPMTTNAITDYLKKTNNAPHQIAYPIIQTTLYPQILTQGQEKTR